MRKTTRAALFSIGTLAFSAFAADKTDWYSNLLPAQHAMFTVWFGFVAAAFTLIGLAMFVVWVVESFDK